jgi:aspartate carbamoyltransferase catalytic subunit
MGRLKSHDLLALREMAPEEMTLILDTAESMKEIIDRDIKKVPTLRGRTVVTLFYEPSTRTRTSFELAGKYLSADTVNLATTTSAVVKGETLKDTARTLEMMGTDVLIMRHPVSGSCHLLARVADCPVVNAGDGMHEHPSQGLLDLFTIRQKKGRIAGLRVAIVGDIFHSRVARSNIWGLSRLGAQVTVAGPSTLLPPQAEAMGVKVTSRVDEALEGADVVNVLRLQLERQKGGLFPSIREYSRAFGVNRERLGRAQSDVLLMHPGPMNRGVEISSEVADSVHSSIEEQVKNGVAVRMAILFLLLEGGEAA